MAHTQIELMMDEFVGLHLKASIVIHTPDLDSPKGEWRLLGKNENLNDGTHYLMSISAHNDGTTETSVRNVQINVNVPKATNRVTFYADGGYKDNIKGRKSQVYPDILGPGETTPSVDIHFMITEGVDELAPIADVELHADVVPQGHATYELLWQLD